MLKYGQHIACWGHTRPVTEVSFVVDGYSANGETKTLLVSSAHDKHPQVRDGESGDWIGSFHGHKGAVWSCKVDQRTRTLAATASGDFSAKLWCATTGKELCDIGKHRHVVKTLDFAGDSMQLATGCQDGMVRIFDTARPEAVLRELEVGKGSEEAVTKMWWKFREENNILILGKKNGLIETHDLRVPGAPSAVCIMSVPTKSAIQDIEVNHRHGVILAAAGKKMYKLDAQDLSIVQEYDTPKGMTFEAEGGVSLSPDGKHIMAGASDLDLREFDAKTGEVLRVFKGHHGPIRCVRYHPSGAMVASGSEDATIRLWGLAE